MSKSECIDTIQTLPFCEQVSLFIQNKAGWVVVLVGRLMAAPFDLLWTWQQRAADRRRLRELDERLRKDIGLARDDLNRMAFKPFWLP